MPEEKRMYTTQEAAELLGMSDSNLRNLIRKGLAQPTAFGRMHMFSIEEIERLRTRPRGKSGRPKQ